MVRGLAVGDIGRGRIAPFVGKRWLVTAVLAVSCGLLAGVLGYFMPGIGTRLALTVGTAVTLAISMAGPFVTVLNDIFCITSYLVLARCWWREREGWQGPRAGSIR